MKRYFLLTVIFLIFSTSCIYSYKDERVILILSSEAQPDSLGYNFVSGFSSWIYSKIKDGKIKLYDSPLKNKEISFMSLKGLEKSSNTAFSETSYLFIYELWSSSKTETEFEIQGFRFINESKGNDIDYGYIDFSDISEMIQKAYIIPNINGTYKTSFTQILMNKSYDFDILFFGNKPIQKLNSKDPEADYLKGKEIINEAFNDNKINLNAIPVRNIKLIEYKIISNSAKYDPGTEKLISALENHFSKNRKDLYNYGGEDIYKYFKKSKVIISNCCVLELWVKKNNKIERKIVQVIPNSLGMTFNTPIKFGRHYSRFAKSFQIENKTLEDFLLTEDIKFIIFKINGQKINPSYSDFYLKALKESPWNKITYAVREFNRDLKKQR